MAPHVFVVDSTARRQQIEVSPTSHLRDVLEEACRKFKRDPNQYALSDSGRPPKLLDLSIQFRLSGLANGTKLQLVQQSRSPNVISVALQLPETLDGTRLQDKFASDTSLWLILRAFEEGAAGRSAKLNITQRGHPSTSSGPGTLDYEQPVIQIMGRELKTFADLQKTLMQLGYNNGSVLLRLSFVASGLPMHLAVEQISQYFVAADTDATDLADPSSRSVGQTASSGAHVVCPGGSSSTTAMQHPAVHQASSDADAVMSDDKPSAAAATLGESVDPSKPDVETEPQLAVYRPSTQATSRATEDYDPSDYIPSIDHAKSHQAALNRSTRNQKLLSDAELAQLEQEKQDRIASIHSTTVRVRLPDQMMLDMTISTSTTPADMYELVRSKLTLPKEPFELRYTGPKGSPITLGKTDERRHLIKDMGFTRRILVTMVWDANASSAVRDTPVLKESLRAQAVELTVPSVTDDGTSVSENQTGSTPQDKGKGKEKKLDVEAKMKKLLGFGKKR